MNEPDDALMPLVRFALEHGVGLVAKNTGPLFPFLLSEGAAGQNRCLTHFVSDTAEKGLERAYATAATLGTDVRRCVLAYDIFVTVGDERFDAIAAEGYERGGPPRSVRWAQRYRPSSGVAGMVVESFGEPLFLGETPPLIREGLWDDNTEAEIADLQARFPVLAIAYNDTDALGAYRPNDAEHALLSRLEDALTRLPEFTKTEVRKAAASVGKAAGLSPAQSYALYLRTFFGDFETP